MADNGRPDHDLVMRVDVQRLRCFVMLCEELHFTRAASRLHVDQSALSRQIRGLERDLSLRLFDRSTRRVELTDAGERLLPEARRTIDQCQRLLGLASELRPR
jgi:DNA-binding transcriptional LysR family regulator